MGPATELLHLIFRWVHVIAAIMWIGNSLLFNWLDRNLRPRPRADAGSEGEIWLLHSGGFYEVEKTLTPHVGLPRPLHWFKWQAYTTWLTGVALLILVYYMSAGAMLVEPGTGLDPRTGVALAIGVLVGGCLGYELLWRSPLARAPALAAGISLVLVVALGYALLQLFTGRAAFLHIGSLLGTLMAANVFTTIMPAQRQLVVEVGRGEPGDPAVSERAKLRSIHNNYMTFPVVILMLISHFPGAYAHDRSWLVLAVLLVAGAAVRHILNIRFHEPRWLPALAVLVLTTLGALWLVTPRPGPAAVTTGPGLVDDGPVAFERVEVVIRQRCTVCHSAAPADRSFGVPAGGVALDTRAQMEAQAPRIRARTIETHTMPPANVTHMTAEERALLARWIATGR